MQKPIYCQHCKKNKRCRPRGLCNECYKHDSIRQLYPSKKKGGHMGWTHEPTLEEVEALIAEQSKPENLPSWWEKDEINQGREV